MNCNKFNFSVWEIHLFYGKSSNRPHLSHSRNREGAGKQCAPTVWSSIKITTFRRGSSSGSPEFECIDRANALVTGHLANWYSVRKICS